MGQAESVLDTGAAVGVDDYGTGRTRFGDYSNMTVDPSRRLHLLVHGARLQGDGVQRMGHVRRVDEVRELRRQRLLAQRDAVAAERGAERDRRLHGDDGEDGGLGGDD